MALKDILTPQRKIFPTERASKPRTQRSFEVYVQQGAKLMPHYLRCITSVLLDTQVAFVVLTKPKPDVPIRSCARFGQGPMETCTQERHTWRQVILVMS